MDEKRDEAGNGADAEQPGSATASTLYDDGAAAQDQVRRTSSSASEREGEGEFPPQQQQQEGPPPPPNGGYGWVCTVCVSIVNAHSWGLNSSYGVFLAHYLSSNTFPGATTLEYAFVGSLSVGCALLVSPLATIATRELGTRPAMMLGVVFQAVSLICASFASQIWHLFLTQGVLFGLAMGFLFVPSVGLVPQWFTTRRSLANGFAAAGSGLGGVVYSVATGAMIRNLGLAWAFRILGIIAFIVNTCCVILIRDRNKAIGSRQLAFDVGLCKRPEYLLLLGYGWFSMLGYIVLVFSLANYANEIGLDASQAALVSAIFNLGQGCGRPVIGYFSDRTGRINMAAVTTFMVAVFAFAIWIPAKVYGVLIFFALVGGAVAGTFWATVAPVTAEVVGLADVPSALNLMWLAIVLPCTFSEPIGLQIVQSTGKYIGAQLFAGFMYVAAGLCLVVLRGWKIGEIAAVAQATHQEPGHIDPVATENNDALSIKSRRAGRKRMLKDSWRLGRV